MHWFFKFVLIAFGLFLLWVIVTEVVPKALPQVRIFNQSLQGIQFQSQLWEGTIWIKGDLIYLPGAAVKVMPGTRIIVSSEGDKSNFDFLPWHLRSGLNTGAEYHGVLNGEYFWDESHKIQIHFGSLYAMGSKEHPVLIDSDLPGNVASPHDFNSISVNSGVISFTQAEDFRRLQIGSNVTVRDSGFKNIAECAICIDSGSPSVINNTFDGGLREAVWVDGASPRITDNTFLSGAGVGVMVDPEGIGAPLISHNNFLMPTKVAVSFLTGDEDKGGEVSYNNIAGSSEIRIACDSKVNILNNNIGGLLSFQGGGCAHTLIIGPNFWGTQNINTVLSARVIKKDPKLQVLIPNLLAVPPLDSGPRQ